MTVSSTRQSLILINAVGLTPAMLGENTPALNALLGQAELATLDNSFPALTTTGQASMLTGLTPGEHGIIGNGWYNRDRAEINFWLQSNRLVEGEKVWHTLRRELPDFSCSNLFWWYNMYSDVDNSITPRPHYPADGRKIMGVYSEPPSLEIEIEKRIGPFPFFNFWGPSSDIRSSRWIVDCAIEEFQINRPSLQLVYLPHLDYNLQRIGPSHPDVAQDIQALDSEIGRLIEFGHDNGAEVMVVSEYGITDVQQSVSLNRILRAAGLLRVRESLSWELLDAGASRAFAVADHQVAHIYIRDPSDISRVRQLLEATSEIDVVMDKAQQQAAGVWHPRSGELLAVAQPGCWFDYYYWLDDSKAPDFARTVDIHRKPGYDPVELFIDPQLAFPKLKAAARLLQKKMGFRMLMDLIPLDTSLVKGSHGRLAENSSDGPLVISSKVESSTIKIQDVSELIKRYF